MGYADRARHMAGFFCSTNRLSVLSLLPAEPQLPHRQERLPREIHAPNALQSPLPFFGFPRQLARARDAAAGSLSEPPFFTARQSTPSGSGSWTSSGALYRVDRRDVASSFSALVQISAVRNLATPGAGLRIPRSPPQGRSFPPCGRERVPGAGARWNAPVRTACAGAPRG